MQFIQVLMVERVTAFCSDLLGPVPLSAWQADAPYILLTTVVWFELATAPPRYCHFIYLR